ncbi:hypothetical protein ACSBR2_008860 [Camellia fascicularis]
MEKLEPCPKSYVDPLRYVKQVLSAGFIKSLSGPKGDLEPNINLEVDLVHSHGKHLLQGPNIKPSEPLVTRPRSSKALLGCHSHVHSISTDPHDNVGLTGLGIMGFQDQGHGRPPTFTLHPLWNFRKSGKNKAQVEGFSRFARLYGLKAAAIGKHTSRSVIFKPAAVALAHSGLSEGDSSLNSFLLKEAKATINLGDKLGINFKGKEVVVLDKIIDLELKDKERINKEGKAKL